MLKHKVIIGNNHRSGISFPSPKAMDLIIRLEKHYCCASRNT